MSQPAPQTNPTGTVAPRRNLATWMTVLRVAAAGLAIVVGLGVVLVTMAMGDCAAFGGSCPRQGGFPDDLFRFAASGGALTVGVPYYLIRPTWHRLATALVVGIVAGVIIGLFAVSATAG